MNIDIIYEDESLIILNKPIGLPVIPGRNLPDDDTLSKRLEAHMGRKPLVVHRLDRETSGVILFAKSDRVHRTLCMQFERREVSKAYLALVLGSIDVDGVIETPIRQFGSGRMGVGPEGKPSKTVYHVLKKFSEATLLEVRPVTGRRHQIRVHLYSIGHPVVGDPLYGMARPVAGCPRLMLHARELTIKMPSSEERTFTAPPDAQWHDLIRQYGPDPVVVKLPKSSQTVDAEQMSLFG